jgi:hypothetical protein
VAALDFGPDVLGDGRRFRVLVLDDFTREFWPWQVNRRRAGRDGILALGRAGCAMCRTG